MQTLQEILEELSEELETAIRFRDQCSLGEGSKVRQYYEGCIYSYDLMINLLKPYVEKEIKEKNY